MKMILSQGKKNHKAEFERQLIKDAKENIKSFDKLYNLYYKKILFYLKKKVNGNQTIAEDLTSITFEKAIKNIKRFQWQGISFSAWIFKIANNTLVDYYRSQDKRKAEFQIHENIKDHSKSIEEKSLDFDSNSRIKSVLQHLDSREKEILTLKFYEGYTNKAIAKKIGLSETNVGTIVHRSIKKIRKLILLRGDIYI